MRTIERLRPRAVFKTRTDPEAHSGETRLDLNTAPLILENLPDMRARVRRELETICRHISGSMPGAGVLLTGSLSVGEGRSCEDGPEPSLESDYDLVILTPSFPSSMPARADQKLCPLMARHRFLAAQEITLIWKPLLALGVTTTAGKLISGAPHLAALLTDLPAPRAAGALVGAYRCLAAVPMAPDRFSFLLSKALVRAARALLLDRCSTAPRGEWVGLSSVKRIRDRMGVFLDADDRQRLYRAGAHLLKEEIIRWEPEDYFAVKGFLDRIRRHVAHRGEVFRTMCHAAWVLKHGGRLRSLMSRGIDPLDALAQLAEAWGPADAPNRGPLMAAALMLRGVCTTAGPLERTEPRLLYAELFDALDTYGSFYPNKIYYPRAGDRAGADRGRHRCEG